MSWTWLLVYALLPSWSVRLARKLACLRPLLHFRAATKARPETQVAAIGCLAELKSVRALRPLEILMQQSSHAAVRRAAAAGLKTLEWVPVTIPQAVAQAVELEDWPGAASLGAAATLAAPAATLAVAASASASASASGART